MKITASFDKVLNYAFQQNAIPLIKELVITNDELPRTDLLLSITTEPGFATALELRISKLAPGEQRRIAPVDLRLSHDFLSGLNEKLRGQLRLDVSAGAELLGTCSETIDVLARNEWCGLVALPEILAAFVLPNDPAILAILGRASEILRANTGRSALNGYQDKNRKHAWEQVAAIYKALSELGLRYIVPPTSFETSGQKVAFPSDILSSRFGTCLDLALLFAACCERAGLAPLVLIHEGHAYAACWLEDRSLPDATSDDLQQVRKLNQDDLLSVLELTLLTAEAPGTLPEAERAARPHLETTLPFRLALDVRRARGARILPLPVAGQVLAGEMNSGGAPARSSIEGLGTRPLAEPLALPTANEDSTRQPTRVDQWKARLLDLSLRNRLLNFRETKGTIRLLTSKPDHIEDELSAETKLALRPRPRLLDETDPRNSESLPAAQRAQALASHLGEELAQGRLHTHVDETEHARRLTEIYRSARNDLDENGTNTLYAAVGFLEWRETEHSDKAHRAPLLLVPVALERKSVIEGFSLRRLDEETRLNVTLVEMLRQTFRKEIPGLDPLPEDEKGVDVARVFRLFRDAVRDLKGWELIEDVWLGQFSFTKFLLWKDLSDRLETLAQNPVVNHLVTAAGAPYTGTPEDISPLQLDDTAHPRDVYCPRSADSSQLAAVLAAAAGHDFVLEGPPGTGKSQTITNIIAHCLATGKRVLFVAEKRAALDVVHRRLSEEGLAPFCLELHSNKAGKADVLQQFREALEFVQREEPAEWEARAVELQQLRDNLNHYARALHAMAPCGLSAHDCFDLLIGDTAIPELSLARTWPVPLAQTTREQLETARLLCRQLDERAIPLLAHSPDGIATHPLASVGMEEWSPNWSERARELLAQIPPIATNLGTASTELCTWLKTPRPALSARAAAELESLATALLAALPVGADFVSTPWNRFSDKLQTWQALAQERKSLRGSLDGYDEKVLLALDLPELKATWAKAQDSWFLLKWLRLGRVRRQLRTARSAHDKPGIETLQSVLDAGLRLRAINETLHSGNAEAASLLGVLWRNGEPEPDTLATVLAWGRGLHSALVTFAGDDLGYLSQVRAQLSAVFAEDSGLFAPEASIGRRLHTFTQARRAFLTQWETCKQTLGMPAQLCADDADHAKAAASVCARMLEAWRHAREWCAWLRLRNEALRAGLAPLLDALERRRTAPAPQPMPLRFERAFRHALLQVLLENSQPLRAFLGVEHEERIRRFRELDATLARLTRELVRARLSRHVALAANPNFVPKTEYGQLSRELAKRMRHIPVRKLLSATPALTARLKPCMLMSPLSVAQYLDPAHKPFDLVIFDEASQIPVWDAVGAIARGRQAVIVGDPRQLPPTNFFNTNRDTDEDDDAYDPDAQKDLESVLDELLANKLRHKRLCWHYRSRHEGLISFSNDRYYDGQLLTFPSPATGDNGVSFLHLPEATYDKGKTRTNPGEAKALVGELVALLLKPDAKPRSYGIVTFSLAQQKLIENLLDEERRLHPELEPHFGEQPPVEGEPVFVKNLENVQGDERDVILFSIGYGRDAAGRLSMNFGPLNRDGGERRLNVAVTRAKHEVRVYSNLTADDIDLTRTRARGVADLKAFLEHAAKGGRSGVAHSTTEKADSAFQEHVAGLLREAGYAVHHQVGSSAYRVDLAVVDPKDHARYLLGIECDGANYRQAATARDRDKLRQAMLEGLGWRMHRIWITDWWHNPEEERKKLLETLRKAAE